MENLGSPVISVDGGYARKKRSNFSRRPNHNPKPLSNYISSSTSSRSLLDNYGGYRNINEIYTNDYSRAGFGREDFPTNNYEDGSNEVVRSDQLGNGNKAKKVKLKVGGITRTIQTKSIAELAQISGASAYNSAEDFHGKDASSAKMLSMRPKMGEESGGKGQSYNSQPARKSKRVPKKRTLDEEFTDEEEDDEIRYLGKLRASKAAAGYRGKHENPEAPDFDYTRDYGASILDKAARKRSSCNEDKDYIEEENPASDNELDKEEHLDSLAGGGNELTITTRKRALGNGKGASPGSGHGVIFSNGLPAATAKRQKEILPEVDQQLRKAEAAQRRRLQAEKAAKEAEAEAIRKILGQDSTRKKREEKLKRQQEELAQEKTAKAAVLGPKTVRWVTGPSGTVVTFSDDLGLPNIFCSLSSSYPPPREKCVGPNCDNEYKYRDSKSNLPLCSLHCYKAVQG